MYYATDTYINAEPDFSINDITPEDINWAEVLIDENNGYWTDNANNPNRKYNMTHLSERKKYLLAKAIVACVKWRRMINDDDFFLRPIIPNENQLLPKFPREADDALAEAGLLNHYGYSGNTNYQDIGWYPV